MLLLQETFAVPRRLQSIGDDVDQQKSREKELQRRFGLAQIHLEAIQQLDSSSPPTPAAAVGTSDLYNKLNGSGAPGIQMAGLATNSIFFCSLCEKNH